MAEQRPDDASTCLLAARLCYEKLDLLSEGISWAERALEREESVPQDLRARCHLYLGVGRYIRTPSLIELVGVITKEIVRISPKMGGEGHPNSQAFCKITK